ncbi:MAG TPA: phosphonate utilization associated transcriptional regulator [Casimicrobiaceae bacterium]|nr:phosphonate utilization associated transcriptional regulator [Casimicrobiaceae bacterium]
MTIYTRNALNGNMPHDDRNPRPDDASPARRVAHDDPPIALIQSSSLPSLIARELTRQILAGTLAAGAKLNEVDVAERLGVSRGPVREAFRALEESGLVRFEKNRGVFVRQVSLSEADEIFELRALLDEFAGRRAAKNATPHDVRELEALVDRMGAAAARGATDEYFALNLEFHDRIVEMAGNAKLAQLYRRLVNELNLYRRASLSQAGTLPVSVAEHRAIVQCIAARQSAAAGRLLHDHVIDSRERAHRAREGVAARASSTRIRRNG